MKAVLLAAALAVAGASAANATIVIAEGNLGGGLDNVLFNNNPPPGLTVTGVLNSTPYFVTFTGTETLVGNGGQARIEPQSGGMNFVSFTLGAGIGFDRAVFNVNTTNAYEGGILTVTAFDQFGGSYSSNIDISDNGQHFVNLTTDAIQLITSVTLSSTLDFADVRQIRLGEAQAIASAVPEPGTWAMMLIGFAGLGYLGSRKQKRAAVAA